MREAVGSKLFADKTVTAVLAPASREPVLEPCFAACDLRVVQKCFIARLSSFWISEFRGMDWSCGRSCADARITEKRGRVFGDSLLRQFVIVLVDLETKAVSAPLRGGNSCCACTHKGVEHRVANKTKHANKSFGEFYRIRCRMQFGRGPEIGRASCRERV